LTHTDHAGIVRPQEEKPYSISKRLLVRLLAGDKDSEGKQLEFPLEAQLKNLNKFEAAL
jgi:hypothetical protein